MNRRGIATITVLAAVVAVTGGAAAGLVLAPERVPASVVEAADEGPGSVPVSGEVFDDARRVAVVPVLAEESSVSVAATGRVTRSTCVPGGVLESGTSPLTLDDRPVVALATSVPLWRDLGPDARGEDVMALQTELARLGYAVRADGRYGVSTRTAVTRLLTAAGVPRPDGTLPTALVLWLPESSVPVAECLAPVGAAFEGGEVATTRGGLVALRVDLGVSSSATPGPRVLRLGEASTPVTDDGTVTDTALLAAVSASPELAAWRLADGEGALQLDYVLAEPLAVTVVPPGALVGLTGDQGCVVADGEPRRVRVVASSLGQTFVVVDGEAPASVTLAPPSGTTC